MGLGRNEKKVSYILYRFRANLNGYTSPLPLSLTLKKDRVDDNNGYAADEEDPSK